MDFDIGSQDAAAVTLASYTLFRKIQKYTLKRINLFIRQSVY
jgi:hypothetical protein